MRKFVISVSVTLLAAVLSTLAFASPTGNTDPSYSFELTGPQTARDPSTGNTILITGGGSFDTGAGTVIASGSFAILNSSGAVVSHGTWKATAFGSFESFGGPNPGTQGGLLDITVTLFPLSGAPMTGVPMAITCLVGAPPPGAEEGITIGSFTNTKRGRTLFHLNA